MISETAISEAAISEGGGEASTREKSAHFGILFGVPHNNGRFVFELTDIGNISAAPAGGRNKP